jgi:hypothetical protein
MRRSSLDPNARLAIGYAPVLGLMLVALSSCVQAPEPDTGVLPAAAPVSATAGAGAPGFRAAQEVFDARCAVCHGCYDAPCQVVLTSPEGVSRGASKEAVYDGTRLLDVAPSRLFVDATTTAGWRERGFFSVLGETTDPADNLMKLMLELGAAHSFAAGDKLPDAVDLEITRELSCAKPDEFADYVQEHPLGGMPYGTASLSEAEQATLAGWMAAGAPTDVLRKPLRARARAEMASWETFLNGTTLKERIVARYLYEHWFLAHLYFDDLPEGPFFRIVRSRTPPGQPVDELATRRPWNPPGADRFWYRLRRIESTIVHKTHTLYELGEARQERLRELFLASEWTPSGFPGYEPDLASNPFVSFAEIPARARYQFLLDNAQYFVMMFIRGPVCRGQIAVNVIEDHFFVAFLDPDHDLSVTDPAFLEGAKEDLNLPAEHLSDLVPGEFFIQYGLENRAYLDRREALYAAAYPKGPALGHIWDGDGNNSNALLTVFRHWDNASVLTGWVGGWPETGWVIDFPIFERIYYDLVAGFDVFGDASHQAATRLYMDHLRMQSENIFLSFLPAERREAIHASWYVGATNSLDYRYVDALQNTERPTQISFRGPAVREDFLAQVLQYNAAVAGPADLLNRCAQPPCLRPGATAMEQRVEAVLEPLAAKRGPWVALLPEVTRLRVRSGGELEAWTLVHNLAHTNVAYMFDEDARLLPAEDTLTIVRGYLGSYPNFAFDVELEELAEFSTALVGVRTEADFSRLAARWGVRRTDTDFWPVLDWFTADFKQRQPTAAGLFDIGRYKNR